jgi:putative oxidoreductase
MPGPMLYPAMVIETVGGALIVLGLFTRWAAFLCSGEMAVAYFYAHQPRGIIPLLNRGDTPVLFCWIFLLIAAKGAGIWSLDFRREAGSG